MFYDIIFALHLNVIVGPGRCIIPGITMGEHACSSFSIENDNGSIENDNGSEVCSPISEYYSMSHSLYYLRIHLVQA